MSLDPPAVAKWVADTTDSVANGPKIYNFRYTFGAGGQLEQPPRWCAHRPRS